MAKLDYGLLGMFSGSVGDVVGVIRNGKQIVRSKPKKSTKEPSPAQISQREKWKLVSSFLTPLKPWFNKYYGEKEKGKTPMNLAMSYHLKEATVRIEEQWGIDFSKVIIAKGILHHVIIAKVNLTKSKLSIHWKKATTNSPLAKPSDTLTLVVYSISTNSFQVFENIATRETQKAIIKLSTTHQEQDNAIWLFVVNQENNKWSSSTYLGIV
ncbi:MAG: DUF6266 family protein [Flavobacteriaceae bacterium]|jgi:hypothetical protein|nr:DUF6266 family protein [Flavobacteriaceae bacterium]